MADSVFVDYKFHITYKKAGNSNASILRKTVNRQTDWHHMFYSNFVIHPSQTSNVNLTPILQLLSNNSIVTIKQTFRVPRNLFYWFLASTLPKTMKGNEIVLHGFALCKKSDTFSCFFGYLLWWILHKSCIKSNPSAHAMEWNWVLYWNSFFPQLIIGETKLKG